MSSNEKFLFVVSIVLAAVAGIALALYVGTFLFVSDDVVVVEADTTALVEQLNAITEQLIVVQSQLDAVADCACNTTVQCGTVATITVPVAYTVTVPVTAFVPVTTPVNSDVVTSTEVVTVPVVTVYTPPTVDVDVPEGTISETIGDTTVFTVTNPEGKKVRLSCNNGKGWGSDGDKSDDDGSEMCDSAGFAKKLWTAHDETDVRPGDKTVHVMDDGKVAGPKTQQESESESDSSETTVVVVKKNGKPPAQPKANGNGKPKSCNGSKCP